MRGPAPEPVPGHGQRAAAEENVAAGVHPDHGTRTHGILAPRRQPHTHPQKHPTTRPAPSLSSISHSTPSPAARLDRAPTARTAAAHPAPQASADAPKLFAVHPARGSTADPVRHSPLSGSSASTTVSQLQCPLPKCSHTPTAATPGCCRRALSTEHPPQLVWLLPSRGIARGASCPRRPPSALGTQGVRAVRATVVPLRCTPRSLSPPRLDPSHHQRPPHPLPRKAPTTSMGSLPSPCAAPTPRGRGRMRMPLYKRLEVVHFPSKRVRGNTPYKRGLASSV